MRRRRDSGFALIFVLGFAIVLSVVLASMYVYMWGRVRDLQLFEDRLKAYYLLQTAASVAIMDCQNTVPPGGSCTLSRDFSYASGGTTYKLHYDAVGTSSSLNVTASMPSPLGLGVTYFFQIGGNLALPLWLRHHPPLMPGGLL